jgi:hypothetical protein
MPYAFRLAAPGDDWELRQVLARSPLPGAVSLAFEREPNYFLANSTMGAAQVLVAREVRTQQVVALAARSERAMFLNGHPEVLGYLGQARLSGRPSPFVISRGFRFLKGLHDAGRARGYITTIVEENYAARQLLVEKPLPHVPPYQFVDRLHTLAILTRQIKRFDSRAADVQVLGARREDLGEIVAFVRRVGARRQFFPAYTEADFEGEATRGFKVEDFLIARRGGEICGVIGLWNQKGFKQSRVHGYGVPLKYLRPAWNIVARLSRMPILPAPGAALRFSYASFACVEGDEARVLQVLVAALLRRARSRGDAFLLLGLCERDPLLHTAQQFAHIAYTSLLYCVSWDSFPAQDGRPAFVEIAAL